MASSSGTLPHKVGERVYAKWPSSNLWFRAKVLDIKDSRYRVIFEEGTEADLADTHVAAETRFRRSSSRSRSRGRSRSPARTRSPARQTKRKQSPSPSPARSRSSSRSRKTAATPKTPKTPVTTPTRRSARIEAIEVAKEEPIVEVISSSTEVTTNHKAETAANTTTTTTTTVKKIVEEVKMGTTKEKKTVTETKEFGGPIGCFFMLFFLPAVVYGVNLACTKKSCTIKSLPVCPKALSVYFDPKTIGIFFGWLLFQVILAVLPIGSVVDGMHLKNGKRLQYRCNGFIAFIVSHIAFGVLVYLGYPVKYVVTHWTALLTTLVVFSFVLSIFLYIKSLRASSLELASNSGSFFYDFFMGRELNPRIGSLDLKFFCELRPGLIGWSMLNLCYLTADYTKNNALNPALALVVAFHFLYVADALYHESAILSTMDITTEGFGFMLAFGDLAWVPGLYALTTRFLVLHPQTYPWYAIVAFGLLNLVGYTIFRGSNSQKNAFRQNPYNPALAHLESIPTSSGKRLLVSGWWGLCRHPNYLGDLIMALAWSLPCGFGHLIPYFYPIYFLILLVHRELRDEHACATKYGKSWDRYCERVKYRIFPYIF